MTQHAVCNGVIGISQNFFLNIGERHAEDLTLPAQFSIRLLFGVQHHQRDFIQACGVIVFISVEEPSLSGFRIYVSYGDELRVYPFLRRIGFYQLLQLLF